MIAKTHKPYLTREDYSTYSNPQSFSRETFTRELLGHAASAVLATEDIRKIMTKNETFSTTITLDFKPDNQWDVLHFTSDKPGVMRSPSPGWIIQVEAIVDATLRPTDNEPSLTDLPRDIVPAALDQRYGIVYNPIGDKNFYRFVQRDTRPDLTPSNVNPELHEAWTDWKHSQRDVKGVQK